MKTLLCKVVIGFAAVVFLSAAVFAEPFAEPAGSGGLYSATGFHEKNSFYHDLESGAASQATIMAAEDGYLQVTVMPETARDSGARWSADHGATWHKSGAKLALEPGFYTLVFKKADGWRRPPHLAGLEIIPGETAHHTVTYYPAPAVFRIGGANRYSTAVEVSKTGWPGGADTVLLARGDDYADALAGSSLAYALDAPILLTATNWLDPEARTEIVRLKAGRVIILGGEAAISGAVRKELQDMGLTVQRISGADRFETAAKIALRMAGEQKSGADTAFIVYGHNFPDALAAAAYAAARGCPILLAMQNSLPGSTVAAIENLDISNVVLVGGTAVIGNSVRNELRDAGLTVRRISGTDRYQTAVELAKEYLPAGTQHLYIATGLNFPDALTGAVLAAKQGSGIILTGHQLPAAVKELLNNPGITAVTIFGGAAAVSTEVETAVAALEDDFLWSFVPATRKVFPDTFPGAEKKALLHGAKNEYLNIQVALWSEVKMTVPVSSTIGELFEALYIETPRTTSWGRWRPEHMKPYYPDPLVPVSEIQLTPGQTKSLWIRIRANQSVQGTVNIGDVKAPVAVAVWPWAVPVAPAFRTSIGLGGKGFAGYYQTAFESEKYWELYEKYYSFLLDYRLSAYRPPYGPTHTDAKKYLTDPRVTTFIADYSANQSHMENQWKYYTGLGVEHKAWFYLIDEPTTVSEYNTARGQIEYLRKVAPGHKYGMPFYTGAADKSTPFDHLSGWMNLWIPQTDYYWHGHGLGDKVRRQAREQWEAGDEVWAYTALAPRGDMPNILLNNTALEHRILFWQLYAEEIFSGYLYWQSTFWDDIDDPWTNQETLKGVSGLWGDGSLIYPLPDGPCGSVRLELIRAGLQDYELLLKAEQALGRPAVMQIVQKVTRSFTDYTRDPALFEAVRVELGEALAKKM